MKTNISGFTILEVMIVLAVTAIIFFMSITFIQGKEAYNQFLVAINNVEAQLNEDINNVRDGSYVFPNNISCSGGSSSPLISISGSDSNQGTNKGCIFVGDAIAFHPNSFYNYLIVGNQFENSNTPLGYDTPPSPNYGIVGSNPTLISNSSTNFEQYFENGLTLVQAKCSGTSQPCMSTGQGSGGLILGISGSMVQQIQVNIYPDSESQQISDPNFANNTNGTLTYINKISTNIINTEFINNTIKLCFKAGGINDSALFTVGGNNSSSVSYKIYYGSTSC
jgi:prepilin-type N-terminal cleavage/methylation domain-containing protein